MSCCVGAAGWIVLATYSADIHTVLDYHDREATSLLSIQLASKLLLTGVGPAGAVAILVTLRQCIPTQILRKRWEAEGL